MLYVDVPKLLEALRDILNVMGEGCGNCCEGCSVEMHEARSIAKEALAR